MPDVEISYSPKGVSFRIKDSLTDEAERYAKTFLKEGDLLSLSLEAAEDGSFHYTSLGGSQVSSFSEKEIQRVLNFVSSKYDKDRYVSHSQPFLIATNIITLEQNAVPMSRAEAEYVLAESLAHASSYVYSIREVESVYDTVGRETIYETFNHPESYVRWNHKETTFKLPQDSTSKSAAKDFSYKQAFEYSNFIIFDATDVERINSGFVNSLAEGISNRTNDFSHLAGIRLRGFSGAMCKQFAEHFRWRGERFVSW